MLKNRFTPAIIAAATLATFTSAYAANPETYVGKAQGHNGVVEVTVTVTSDGKIKKIDVAPNKETVGIADSALRLIPEKIVAEQTLAVDSLTGASFTSAAVIGAVEDALKKAGIDVVPFKVKKTKKVEPKVINKEVDIVVIGGGGAGLSAAVGAAENNASVIVIEKTASIGGNTMRAGGGYNYADPARQKKLVMTPAQVKTIESILAEKPRNELHRQLIEKVKKQFSEYKASGANYVFDSPEFHAIQSYKAGDYEADLPLVYEMCLKAPETAEHLAKMGFKWNDRVSTYIGALWPRSHDASNFKSGFGFIQTYEHTIKDKKYPVEFMMQTRAQELMTKGARVAGVQAVDSDGNIIRINATKGVIITAGGFGANVDMRMKYDELWNGLLDEKFKTTNSPAITGDGIIMAQKVGAAVKGMGKIQLLVGDPNTGVTSTLVGMSTSMYVNRDGKRFVNELERRDNLVKAILKQPGKEFLWITTQKNGQIDAQGLNKYGLAVDDLIRQGVVYKSDTVEGLAKFIGCEPENIVETVRKWREYCKTQVDPEFGRNAFNPDISLDEGPYYAVWRKPSVHHTMGGISINTKAQVLNTKGEVIEGLWAAGEVTGGIHGANRVGANAIPDALSFGRIAGVNAAKSQ